MGRRANCDRVEVLQTTTSPCQERGLHRLSVEDLIDATGINRFAIYEKFGGKAGLFYETLDYYRQVIIEQQQLGPLRGDDALLDGLLRMPDVVRGVDRDATRRSGCLIVNANIELGGRDLRALGAAR